MKKLGNRSGSHAWGSLPGIGAPNHSAMHDEITAAIKVALASRAITISDADATAVRSAIERVWGARPKEEGIFGLRDAWAALRLYDAERRRTGKTR